MIMIMTRVNIIMMKIRKKNDSNDDDDDDEDLRSISKQWIIYKSCCYFAIGWM
jgi:hypothetical protein